MPKNTFTANRPTQPHWPSAVRTLQASDATVRLDPVTGDGFTATIGKSTDWTPTQITQAQSVIDTAPADTANLRAQAEVDEMSLFLKAMLLSLVDQINILRSRAGLATFTLAQVLQAVKDKAATL